MNKEALLAALETPKTINALQVIVNPGGSIVGCPNGSHAAATLGL